MLVHNVHKSPKPFLSKASGYFFTAEQNWIMACLARSDLITGIM